MRVQEDNLSVFPQLCLFNTTASGQLRNNEWLFALTAVPHRVTVWWRAQFRHPSHVASVCSYSALLFKFIHVLPTTPLPTCKATLASSDLKVGYRPLCRTRHSDNSPPCFDVSENEVQPPACWVNVILLDEKSPAQFKIKFLSITCSNLLCDCI